MSLVRAWRSRFLGVRYLQASDLAAVAAMLARETVCASLPFGPHSPRETQACFAPLLKDMEGQLARGRRPMAPVFALLHPRSGAVVGQAALLPTPSSPGAWTVGYQLDEPHWGHGYGTWAARFLVQHGFATLDARRLSAECFATNRPSARVLVKAGFRPEGTQRAQHLRAGEAVDNLLFGLLPDDLETGRLAEWQGVFRSCQE